MVLLCCCRPGRPKKAEDGKQGSGYDSQSIGWYLLTTGVDGRQCSISLSPLPLQQTLAFFLFVSPVDPPPLIARGDVGNNVIESVSD